MSMTNADLDSELTHQARQETIGKYRAFIDEVYQDIASQDEKLNIDGSCFAGLEPFRFLEQNARSTENENTLIYEHTNYFELLQTCGNTQLNKLMLVFATLTEELNELKDSASKFINILVLYREDCVVANEVDTSANANGGEFEDDEFTATATILPVLFDIICYLRRCYEVATNLILQQHTMLSYATVKTNDKSFQSNLREILPDLNSNIRFDVVWTALANLSVALINLDHVFASQSNTIRRDIFNYKRSLEMVSKNLTQFGLESRGSEIQTLLTVLEEVQKELFEGRIAGRGPPDPVNGGGQEIDFLFFKGLVISILNTNFSENGAITRNVALNENMAAFIKQACIDIEQNHDRFIDEHRLLATASVYSIYVHLFWKDSDRRLSKTITDVQRKMNISFVHLQGNISISPDQVLIHTLPKGIVDKKVIDLFATQREALMKAGFMDAQVRAANLTISQWLVTMEQSLNSGFYNDSPDGDTLKLVFGHIQLLKEGFEHIRHLSSLVRNCIAIHYTCQRPVSRTDTIALCKAVILLKGVQRFFISHKKMLIEVTAHYQKYNACALLNILTRTKRKILSNVNNYSEQKLDLLSAIILAANCLNGPVLTAKRYTLSSLCLAYATPYEGAFTPDDLTKFQILIRRIHFFINIFATVRRMFDCEFLYFNRAIIQMYFRHFYDSACASNANVQSTSLANISELQYFFAALDDALPLLQQSFSERQSTRLVAAFTEDVFQCFKLQLLNPLCKDFEDELRFRTHSHLQVGDKSPFVRNLKDFQSLLSAEPFKLGAGRKIVWIKSYVENYLNELAYNMTAIALHDWKTYESMLGFARDKFGLEFASLQLPTQTLEQGLDVLEITRNIQIFVAAYLYNLNNQFFVERSSSNKHLNVLTIRHVANSIQTHGFGIINSTVNFAYQFLKKKFQTLSQFLFEEHIKSRLIKDIRHFRELIAKQEASGASSSLVKFPFERAEKFVKGIRRLGVTGDGVTYLDKFRQLLTQIGNVLGFVRMLRSGALHCTSEIANFVPDLDDLGQFAFEELLREESGTFNAETIDAARNFDSALSTIATNFSDATDYFKLLVEVFAPTMRDPKNMHLRNFFVVLPATTYNYVQHIIISKEKLARKNKQEGATFTDDGFAMGVIYVLKLLDQLSDFDSLQWFSSVSEHVRQAIKRSNEITSNKGPSDGPNAFNSAASAGPVDDKLIQTTSLTIKRLEMFHREFQLLKFGMSSCRILFKSSN